MTRHGEWTEHASCAETGPDDHAWFPNSGNPAAAVRRICRACPVRTECLTHAIAYDELGVWAGTTEKQRRRMGAKRPCRECLGPLDPDAGQAVRYCGRCADRVARRVRAEYDRIQRRDRTA